MPLPLELAHRRYVQQAGWTAQLRRHVFSQTGLANAQRVLEVGCGTGAVLQSVVPADHMSLFGLDIDMPSLILAKRNAGDAILSDGDAHRLPFQNSAFDITYCHYVLLWLRDPNLGLQEMRRVTRPGGAVIAFAEPDYSNRVDHPDLAQLGRQQTEALRAQGANPELGGKLAELFRAAGFTDIESGDLGAEEGHEASQMDHELELEVLQADLEGHGDEEGLLKALALQKGARQNNARVVYVPTLYAWARV